MKPTETETNLWQSEATIYTHIDRALEIAQCYGVHHQITLQAREDLLFAVNIYGKACEAMALSQHVNRIGRTA